MPRAVTRPTDSSLAAWKVTSLFSQPYIVGLDPDFMRIKNERLFERWKAITRGKVRHPEDAILKEFGCEYVFTDQEHNEFIAVAERSKRIKKVYSDRDTRVYQVHERSTPAS